MHTNVAINRIVHLVNSQMISDNKQQILNMNKRMKVRRKLRQLPRSFGLALQTSLSSSTKIIFLSSLILCHLLGFTLCIGKLNFGVVVVVIYFRFFYDFCFCSFFRLILEYVDMWVYSFVYNMKAILLFRYSSFIFSSCFRPVHIRSLKRSTRSGWMHLYWNRETDTKNCSKWIFDATQIPINRCFIFIVWISYTKENFSMYLFSFFLSSAWFKRFLF